VRLPQRSSAHGELVLNLSCDAGFVGHHLAIPPNSDIRQIKAT
jgi:hypothetical protein